jgi:RNA-directed DNA polymerase
MEEEMETLYTEGVAIHGGPESCVGDPRGRSEALTGVHVGRAIEPRNNHFGVPTLSPRWKATLPRRYREPLVDPARSENQGMRGAFMRENREIP